METKSYAIILLVCIAISIILSKMVIPFLRNQHIGQTIREDGPQSHFKKQGTPTMGGIIIILTTLIGIVLFGKFSQRTVLFLVSTLGFGLIGSVDDFMKLFMKRSLGLTALQKIILQVLLAFCISIWGYMNGAEQFSSMRVPFTNFNVNFGIFSIPIMMFIIVGTVNATNLTDGLDGLVTGVTIPVIVTLAIIGFMSNNETVVYCLVFLGSLIGFLFFNSNPASVFMGDTGSMAIGGAVAALVMLLDIPLFLVIIGGIYVAEALSVIIQVTSYKLRHGKRVFLMSPIHHHYELKGYKESKIVTTFSLVSLLLCLVTLIIY